MSVTEQEIREQFEGLGAENLEESLLKKCKFALDCTTRFP